MNLSLPVYQIYDGAKYKQYTNHLSLLYNKMGISCSRIVAVEKKVEVLSKDLQQLYADVSQLKQDTAVKKVVEDIKQAVQDAVKS